MNITKNIDCVSPYNYNALIETISFHLENNSTNIENAIIKVSNELKLFGTHGFKIFISELLNNHDLLEKIAQRSYLHGNGFYKIILEDNLIFRLRLHIWIPTSRAEENIHDHRWHFASAILTGSMETEIWEDAIPGIGEVLDEYHYIGTTENEPAKNIYMGKSRVSLKEKIRHSAGDAYHLMSNIMHRICYDGNDQIATLMCHTKNARSWARTITKKVEEPDVSHSYIDVEKLKGILQLYSSV